MSKGYYTRIDTLITTGKIKFILLEMFIVSLSPYYFLKDITFEETVTTSGGTVTIRNSLNEVLTVTSLFKMFYIIRAFMYFSRFNNPRAQRVCQMNGCKATTLFGIKSVVQENPYILMSILFVSSALVGAYALQVFERKL